MAEEDPKGSARIRTRNRLPFLKNDFNSNPPTPKEVAAELDRRQSELIDALLRATPVPGVAATRPRAAAPTATRGTAGGISKRFDVSTTPQRPTENVLVAVVQGLLKEQTETTVETSG